MNHSETKKLVVTTGVPSANVYAERVSLVNEAGQPISTKTDAELNSRYLPWQPNTTYTAGTFVSNAGSLYTVNSNFTTGATFSTTGLTVFSSSSGIDATGVTAGYVLTAQGDNTTDWEAITFNGTLPVANGGTGATTASTARTALGLGSIATQAASAVTITGGSVVGITDIAVADGGTGASTASAALTNLGAAPLPTGTPTVGQVPVVSTVSPLAMSWGAGAGSSTPEIEDWTVLGNLGATETITGASNIVRRRIGTLDQACTVTIATSANQQLDVILVQDATGGRAVTFSGVDVWVTSTRSAPSTTATTATSLDRFRFENIAGTCYGYWLTEPIVATPLASTRYRKSGKYYSCDGRTSGTTALTASRLLYARFETHEAITLDRIGVSVTVAGAASVIRLGIYNDDGDGHPGTKLLDAGTVDSTATGDLEITISQALPIGVYWLCAVAQGGTPTIRTWAAGNDTQWIGVASTAGAAQNDPLSYNQAGVTGALPSTATPVGENRTLPRIWVRLA